MELTETTLGGNQLLEDWQASKYNWREEPYSMDTTASQEEQRRIIIQEKVAGRISRPRLRRPDQSIILRPFEIRTFIARQNL